MTNVLYSCPTSMGEILDKISVLEIKLQNIKVANKINFISRELDVLNDIVGDCFDKNDSLYLELFSVNLQIWNLVDKQYQLEASNKAFSIEYAEVSFRVSELNKKRFMIKRDINKILSPDFMEQKQYD